MSLFGRIGAYFAVCMIASVSPYSFADSGDKAAVANCTIPDAKSAQAFGAQLYTVRAAMAQDFEGSLCRIAQMGYREVEFAGLYGRDPNEIRGLLDQLKLKAIASHADWQELRDNPAKAIRDAKALGADYLVLAWLPADERKTIAQWRWWIDHLNKVGKFASGSGIALLYHAHDFEYEPVDGLRPIDLLHERLDPGFVNFEMDVYWTVKGGGDPVTLLRQHPGRFPLAHIKDMQRDSTGMADVGDGRIDFAAIFAAADERDFRHIFVERDEAGEPFKTLRRSLAHLKSIERKPER